MPTSSDRSISTRSRTGTGGGQEVLDKLAASLYPREMDTPAAEHRLRVLEFWEKHGTEATRDAFGVGRTTLYRWKTGYRLGQAPPGPEPKSRARRANHQRRVDPRVLAEAIRLRTAHPRLGKEKLLPLLRRFVSGRRRRAALGEPGRPDPRGPAAGRAGCPTRGSSG